ncbi:MAG TPA: glycosyltransferase family 9 protein [Candidatus Methylacidiphilales bacterium]|jgi:ADP-heptose:LPS heptosyltransferase|nr:glycosyltransferase family 9 protein [Candidatus Methylacidiphilales bacterium]
MKKLILKNFLPPGDIIMLTAAVRDLHRCYPGQFQTDVRTLYDQLWENNPYLTPLEESDPNVKVIECHYPLVQKSDDSPFHFIYGFIDYLNRSLDLKITPTLFKGDIHLSSTEKSRVSQVQQLCGEDIPFWIVVAGGKNDFTVKWWDTGRFQEVIDYFRGKIIFVQVGKTEDHHPALKNAIDLRGKTDLRQLIHLVYHAKGVLSPITSLMHLAAAVEFKGDTSRSRPCVVVAGGREPPQWEAYPSHQFIHTIGALPCCATGGCWKSRTLPLGDGSNNDRPENLCRNVVGKLPYCMDMITPEMVIRRIEIYFDGTIATYLNHNQADKIDKIINSSMLNSVDKSSVTGSLSNFYDPLIDTLQFVAGSKSRAELAVATELIQGSFVYGREGRHFRKLEFLSDGRIGDGAGGCEVYWNVKEVDGNINLYIFSEKQLTCTFERLKKNIWIGRWFRFKQVPTRLAFHLRP